MAVLLIAVVVAIAGFYILMHLNEKEDKEEQIKRDNIVNNADAIRKYKELLDDGIITQEEFEAKKKELLNP